MVYLYLAMTTEISLVTLNSTFDSVYTAISRKAKTVVPILCSIQCINISKLIFKKRTRPVTVETALVPFKIHTF